MASILEAFTPEDRVSVKFSDFYKLMREGAKAEMMLNAVNCDVPHKYVREMMTGKKEFAETCGKCKHCKANDICNGDHICNAKGIEVSQDDDIRFYGEQNNEPCEAFEAAD